MLKNNTSLFVVLFGVFYCALLSSCSTQNEDGFTERVKISLRDVGNKLLLTTSDSTSLILPVVVIEDSKYQVSFNNSLSFDPADLVTLVKQSFKNAELPSHYRVEVIQCKDHEVAYSYQITKDEENTIIPCAGRVLPNNCYTIEVFFTKQNPPLRIKTLLYVVPLVLLFLLAIFYVKKTHFKVETTTQQDTNFAAIGSYQFYPEKNKLVKAAQEIKLSKKECELLEIFYEHLNEVVKREELEKRVWEDNGVFVGRSLDTYISKLRKKLKDDASIKLINVHGIGYKLEVI
ncbi:winged helix-turn-helix domain-containing protein [Lacinutrix salivirga]